jgi:endonuclease YncB( thermonuclease family)
MLQNFVCCFRSKNVIPPVIKPNRKSIEDVCVRINFDTPSPPRSSLTLLDTKSMYDSTEFLYKLDKPIEWTDTLQFIPPVDKGIVIKVYDGDTITIASKLPYNESPLYRFSVRLAGIDCPEIKGKNDNEKECAQIAKKELSDLILHKIVSLKNVETEKYGRILADVYLEDLHLNSHMIEKRLAVTYDGGTKLCPTNWMNYYINGEM